MRTFTFLGLVLMVMSIGCATTNNSDSSDPVVDKVLSDWDNEVALSINKATNIQEIVLAYQDTYPRTGVRAMARRKWDEMAAQKLLTADKEDFKNLVDILRQTREGSAERDQVEELMRPFLGL